MYILRNTHNPADVICSGVDECERTCQWGNVLGEELYSVIPTEEEAYITEWMHGALDSGTTALR